MKSDVVTFLVCIAAIVASLLMLDSCGDCAKRGGVLVEDVFGMPRCVAPKP